MTLLQVELPDTVVTHAASACGQCSAALAAALVVKRERRQVMDLPPIRPQVTVGKRIREEERETTRYGCYWLTDHTKNEFSSPLRLLFHELFDGYKLQGDALQPLQPINA